MKWYPFWKIWYFTKEQRLGIGIIIMLIVLVAITTKKDLYQWIRPSSKIGYTEVNQERWRLLQAQIDSSVNLAQQEREAKAFQPSKSPQRKASQITLPVKSSTVQIVNINEASALELTSLKGIGEVYSQRIVKYRDKLGGFYDINQLREVYGLQDIDMQYFESKTTLGGKSVQKININSATTEQLSEHPYINYKLANQIVNYRNKVKAYDSIQETIKLYVMNDSVYNKLLPYLTID